jgi:hypothetical protein
MRGLLVNNGLGCGFGINSVKFGVFGLEKSSKSVIPKKYEYKTKRDPRERENEALFGRSKKE